MGLMADIAAGDCQNRRASFLRDAGFTQTVIDVLLPSQARRIVARVSARKRAIVKPGLIVFLAAALGEPKMLDHLAPGYAAPPTRTDVAEAHEIPAFALPSRTPATVLKTAVALKGLRRYAT